MKDKSSGCNCDSQACEFHNDMQVMSSHIHLMGLTLAVWIEDMQKEGIVMNYPRVESVFMRHEPSDSTKSTQESSGLDIKIVDISLEGMEWIREKYLKEPTIMENTAIQRMAGRELYVEIEGEGNGFLLRSGVRQIKGQGNHA